jgi:hypothetical protein
LILVFLMTARAKIKTRSNGHKSASVEQVPASTAAAYDCAVHETPVLHSGARLAAKLNAKIILNDTEFNYPGEMSVDDRRLYHEALASVFPASIAVSVNEAWKIKHSMADRDSREHSRWRFLSLAARLFWLKR